MRRFLGLLLCLPSALLSACNFAPDDRPSAIEMPAKFKEGGNGTWQEARPGDEKPRGPWWRSFNDRTLDELEPQVELANQDLAAALAAVDQAHSLVAKAQAGLLPTVDINNSYSANKESAHRPTRKSNTPFSTTGYFESLVDGRPLNEPDHFGNNQLGLQSQYEIDLWGRVRNLVAASEANAESSAALLESVRLVLQGELARTYVALRGLDSEIKLLSDTVEAYRKALSLTQTRVQGQIASPADSGRAETQLELARAQLFDVRERRALLEHAIATLIGKPASSFTLASGPNLHMIPKTPTVAPSTLLERRPDIAAAERQVAAANAAIGVARAAFFPRLLINLSAGSQDTGLSLFNIKNSIWSLGPAVTLPIFDGGLRAADLSRAEAAYLETVAHYRSAVLRAIQEVEDSLAQIHWLDKESRSLEAASASSQKVLSIALTLYRDGATNYLDVVTAQTAALETRRAVLILRTRRLEASVGLMLALGGGWRVTDIAVAKPAAPSFVPPPVALVEDLVK